MLNSRIKGTRKIITLRGALCKRLIDEPRFFFPHQLDHRGRAYPVPQLINPQSDDGGRSVLEFADGKPLGEAWSVLAGDPPCQLLLEEGKSIF
jgi:DNA-directed RNA polymerase, mitochondrial